MFWSSTGCKYNLLICNLCIVYVYCKFIFEKVIRQELFNTLKPGTSEDA